MTISEKKFQKRWLRLRHCALCIMHCALFIAVKPLQARGETEPHSQFGDYSGSSQSGAHEQPDIVWTSSSVSDYCVGCCVESRIYGSIDYCGLVLHAATHLLYATVSEYLGKRVPWNPRNRTN